MFGDGVTGEIVVNSKQQGKIVMSTDAEYLTGARLYFDAKRMAHDGLLYSGWMPFESKKICYLLNHI